MARIDPLRNFRYRLEIDNGAQAGFSEVMIGETAIDAIVRHKGTIRPHVRKLPARNKYANITLTRGLIVGEAALALFKWHTDVSAGQIQAPRKKVVIVVQDEAGRDAARFVVSDACPVRYDPSSLTAKGNEVLIDLLELANEGVERVA